ncbi:hypothetical protein THRCLA_06029 [Thraustotheca clavata]|uniref:Uncharacterized protein n=1 Tax=Thraustotheca clavata TaxID=74557 RepID=A0A1V9ZQS2_9STRA|nr:hypothetical protein THRCLA_06029 [Thraustotheca clavata]
MNRKLSFDNRVCYEREVERNQKLHTERLRTMQSSSYSPAFGTLDNSPPKRYVHLTTNFKKSQLTQERYEQIYQENQLLVRKMNKIVSSYPVESAVEFQPGMRLTSEQIPILDSYLSMQSLSKGCAIEKGSMNSGYRQRQQNKIEDENRKMLIRLTNKKSAYNASKWDQEYKQNLIRFKHVHQDTTIGYLSPKQKNPSPYKDKSALPILNTARSHDDTVKSPRRLAPNQAPARISTTGSTRGTGYVRPAARTQPNRKQTYSTKSVPVLLLEATTSMGVHFKIEEIQVTMVTPTETHLGDQGFLIRAKKDEQVGKILIGLSSLKEVAQAIPDRFDIIDKLNTIQTNQSYGNFPRVSLALDENCMKPLLIKLIQSVRVTVLEDNADLNLSLEILFAEPIPQTEQLKSFHGDKGKKRTVLSMFVDHIYPSRTLLKYKDTIYLCHVHVYQFRRLLTFHAFDAKTEEAINYQFSESDVLGNFKSPPTSVSEVCRSLLKLALKRI